MSSNNAILASGLFFLTLGGLAAYSPVNEPARLRIVASKIRPPIEALRDDSARAWGLPPKIFRAVEIVESSGGKFLRRYEPGYARRLAKRKPAYVKAAAEAGWSLKQLSTSYGSMHVLGVHYYEKGYAPGDVNDAELNYELAANYLSQCKKKGGTWRKALLLWNGGNDLKYPVRVARVAIALGVKSKKG